jgi:hypothetical protein
MAIRLSSFVVISAVFAAGGLATYAVERASDATPAVVNPASVAPQPSPMGGADLPSDQTGMLPPGHPSIGGATSPLGSGLAAPSDPPALVWKKPATWEDAPNPNAMRLATYRVPGGAEVSVSRAGGETEANIQRWVSQFTDVGHQGRSEKTVHGLRVVIVDIDGTYVGSAMTGAQPEARPKWAMVAAIVETPGLPYFFKMTGPAAAIRASRTSLDGLVDGIAPM